jgi:lysophospholipase L1-like esterase
MDPFDPMLSSESCEPIDHREPWLFLMPGILAPGEVPGNAATHPGDEGAGWAPAVTGSGRGGWRPVSSYTRPYPLPQGGQVRRVAALVAIATAAVAAVTSGCAASAPARHASPRASYYLSLGDSLSQGVQPDPAGASVPTRQGYADQLYGALRRDHPGLRLVKLGCTGETTATMIHGRFCSYPGGSQLAAAASFLRAHRGRVTLITIDIGANDPDSCVTRSGLGAVMSCLAKSFPATLANLRTIMAGIRAAAGGTVRIIGMNYYVPTLAEWRNGLLGQTLARVSEGLVVGYNRLLTGVYGEVGARVADVFGAFHSGDFSGQVTLRGIGAVPPNVAAICRWTWECVSAPRGPNIHADAAGYGVIAQAFRRADLG